jgi:acyl-coenzyme A thioesterase PaaI-like protein
VNELLDVVTRVYEYQRAYPALVGTASGLETIRLVLQGKLPTPPIIATLGISLVDAAERRSIFDGFSGRMTIQYPGSVHGGWLLALLDSAPGLRGPNRAARSLRFTTLDLHVRFVAVEQVEYKPKCESRALLTHPWLTYLFVALERTVPGPAPKRTPVLGPLNALPGRCWSAVVKALGQCDSTGG